MLTAADVAANYDRARSLAAKLSTGYVPPRERRELLEDITTCVGYTVTLTDGTVRISWPKEIAELAGEPKMYVADRRVA